MRSCMSRVKVPREKSGAVKATRLSAKKGQSSVECTTLLEMEVVAFHCVSVLVGRPPRGSKFGLSVLAVCLDFVFSNSWSSHRGHEASARSRGRRRQGAEVPETRLGSHPS